jgi:hypothetical protein
MPAAECFADDPAAYGAGGPDDSDLHGFSSVHVRVMAGAGFIDAAGQD